MRAESQTYFSMIYLTSEIFILPNAKEGTLEFWKIPTPQDVKELRGLAPEPIRTLELPPIRQGWTITHFAARCDPNPAPTGGLSDAPFHSSPDLAIALFEVSVDLGGMFDGSYSLFISRRDLRSLIPGTNAHSGPETGSTVETAPDSAPSESEVLDWGPWGDLVSLIPTSTPWDEWGPPISLILKDNRVSRWLTTTSGERFTLSKLSRRGFSTNKIMILDFNPHTISRLNRERAAYEEAITAALESRGADFVMDPSAYSIGSLEVLAGIEEDTDIVKDHARVENSRGCFKDVRRNKMTESHFFARPVRNELPYVLSTSKAEYVYNGGTIIDGERIIGLKVCT